jgi:succinate dehydrogenase / fumarate reductase flavoprotein subunit
MPDQGATGWETHDYDVVVVGAGGAGLRAAIEASAEGARTALVCKSLLGKAHTVMAEGGVAAALAVTFPEDGWQVHFRDTMRGGKLLNNWRMAEIHAKEAPDRVRELEAWGAVFDRSADGRIAQRPFGGHTWSRLAHTGDRTGLEMIRTLQDRGVHQGLDVFMEATVTDLFQEGRRVSGALAYRRATGDYVLFRAKAVVLATGGIGKAWSVTSNSWEYTADGHALAYRAGADLIDCEFVQFHPTGMVWPPSIRGTLVTEGVRGEGGILRNSKGERFMFRYVPDMFKGEFAETDEECRRWVAGDRKNNRRPPELLTRDVVAKAIRAEVAAGRGSPHGGAFLDIATQQSADYIQKKLPSMYHQFKTLANVDITKEPMEVGPTTHYHMGGVRVDAETAESTVPGLFAAGEVAAGMHGANRLGGNSLSDLLVFGRRAGAAAAALAKRTTAAPRVDEADVRRAVERGQAPMKRTTGPTTQEILERLHRIMDQNVGIIRDARGLEQAVKDLGALARDLEGVRARPGRVFNPDWNRTFELQNLVLVSEAVARAARERTESRGAHTRDDHPGYDAALAKVNVVIRRGPDGAMTVTREPIPAWPDAVRALVESGGPGPAKEAS